jgi:predicted nucleotidyltransferase
MSLSETWLRPHWIEYQAVIGSRAYGLAHENSDWDLRGWYLPPIDETLGLKEAPEQVSVPGEDTVYYEIKKLIRLALQGNPNILEILWSPQVRRSTVLSDWLLSRRGDFLSQRLRNTHLGYAMEQFHKMERAPEAPWKHAMHLLRVLLAGISAFETGEILVEITDPEWLETLKRVRAGQVSRADFDTLHQDLRARFDRAVALQELPPEPDFEAANDFLLRARYYAWNTNRS